ncbi:MAG: 4'-phosphopantetheinyl transferase superfamily protein [Candidatus Bipolaricaulota bacterium]
MNGEPERASNAPRVDVWTFALDVAPDFPCPVAQASAAEVEAPVAHSPAAERSLAAWALARAALSETLGLASHEAVIDRSRGKPRLLGVPHSLSLSHSGPWALFAVSADVEVGVDLERIDPDVAVERLAARFFAPREAAALQALKPAARREAFFRIWTRKEAVLKACGGGVPSRLRRVLVPLDDSGREAAVLDGAGGEARWLVQSLAAPVGYAAAIATSAPAAVWQHEAPKRTRSSR